MGIHPRMTDLINYGILVQPTLKFRKVKQQKMSKHSFRFEDVQMNRDFIQLLKEKSVGHDVSHLGYVNPHNDKKQQAWFQNIIKQIRNKRFKSWQLIFCPAVWLPSYEDYMIKGSIPYFKETSDGETHIVVSSKFRPHLWKLKTPQLSNEQLRTLALDYDVESIMSKVKYSKTKYSRKCLYRDEMYEVILVCFKGLQSTPMHDHRGSNCMVRCISGKVVEHVYGDYSGKNSTLSLGVSRIIEPGDTMGLPGHTIHEVSNLDPNGTVLLNFYSPPQPPLEY